MTKPIKIVSRETLYEGFGTLARIVFERTRRDGTDAQLTRDILDTGDSASILPYDKERGTIILVRQFRGVAFLQQSLPALVETCAGKLQGSDPLSRIIRETEEEIGIRLTSAPRRLFEAYSSPGSFAERLTFFVAPYSADDRVSEGGGLRREGEDIEVIETTLDEALAMIERGDIVDAKTMVHLFWAKASGLMS